MGAWCSKAGTDDYEPPGIQSEYTPDSVRIAEEIEKEIEKEKEAKQQKKADPNDAFGTIHKDLVCIKLYQTHTQPNGHQIHTKHFKTAR